MASLYAGHRLRNNFGLAVAIAGMVCAGAGVVAFIGILYLANFTPILPLSDASVALPIVCASDGGALLLGIIALLLLRNASRQFKGLAWITVGTSLLIAWCIFALLIMLSAFVDG